jgi:hypothetical protein
MVSCITIPYKSMSTLPTANVTRKDGPDGVVASELQSGSQETKKGGLLHGDMSKAGKYTNGAKVKETRIKYNILAMNFETANKHFIYITRVHYVIMSLFNTSINVPFIVYADDLILFTDGTDCNEILTKLENCFTTVISWCEKMKC